MKHYFDMGSIMDEIFDAAENIGNVFQEGFDWGPHFKEKNFRWKEGVDFYPAYSYPPTNVYLTPEKQLVFEFALAGFDEKDVDLEFKGDYMIFSAKLPEEFKKTDEVRYFKRRLKFKDIDQQKYYVPEDKFDREKVKAVFKNGVLKVVIPPKEEFTTPDGIKIEIVKEGK